MKRSAGGLNPNKVLFKEQKRKLFLFKGEGRKDTEMTFECVSAGSSKFVTLTGNVAF